MSIPFTYMLKNAAKNYRIEIGHDAEENLAYVRFWSKDDAPNQEVVHGEEMLKKYLDNGWKFVKIERPPIELASFYVERTPDSREPKDFLKS